MNETSAALPQTKPFGEGQQRFTPERFMTTTRVPSEAELIEVKNFVLSHYERWADGSPAYGKNDRVVATMRSLLDLARTVQNPGK